MFQINFNMYNVAQSFNATGSDNFKAEIDQMQLWESYFAIEKLQKELIIYSI